MLKNSQWDTKTKIKTALLMFFAIFAGILHESAGREWTSARMIFTQLGAAVAFAAFVAITVNAKAYSLKSAQGISILIMVAFVFLAVISRRYFTHEALLMLLFAPLMFICSQMTVLVPVAAVIGWYVALKHDGVAVMCMPAVVGASLVALSAQVEKSPVWKKILFVISEVAIIAAAVFTLYTRRYFITTYAFITDIWDSIGILLVAAMFIALAVVSIKKKRSVGEIVGYILSSAMAAVLMFMSTDYSLTGSCAMLMITPIVCQSGSLAEEIGDKLLEKAGSKIKE